ncbi:MAG TPA: hypothetical protein VNS31_05705, partial [Ramlibacter sp.]|nr:hypothetical protein [Ramlibacter sp.]
WLLGLAAVGFAWCLRYAPSALRRLLAEHPLVLGGLLGLALAIAASEAFARVAKLPLLPPFVPAQIGLALCAAPLAIFLMDRRLLKALALVFLAVCAWHFVAMPVEAVWGAKLTWHTGAIVLPRSAGPLNFQASGLALQAYFFSGLFAPMLYLAAGPLFERELLASRRLFLPLSLAWVIPCICVQSRSLFAGALAASLFYFLASRGGAKAARWLLAAGLALVAAAAYWYLFSSNKSGLQLRWAYLELYAREALRWPWVAIGRGFSVEPDLKMLIPGLTPITHSHNDVVQMVYFWGLPALVAYLVFWCGLLRLVWRGFVARKEYWPVCALLVAVPGMVTDLGFELYEKAAFLVILAALCMAMAPASRRGAIAAEAPPATP